MKISKFTSILIASSALVLASCADGISKNQGTATAIGALAGGLIGNSRDDNGVQGAIIGGAIGAGIGTLLDRQEAALREDLAGSGATIINTGDRLIVSMPEAITFETNSSSLRPSLQTHISSLARSMNEYPDTRIMVYGHTDSVGSHSYNSDLSNRRAQAVAGALINSGVNGGRIRSSGLGESQPVASNDTAEGRAANRRVEIQIVPN